MTKRRITITEGEHNIIKLALRKMAQEELSKASCFSEVKNCISTLEVLANVENYSGIKEV